MVLSTKEKGGQIRERTNELWVDNFGPQLTRYGKKRRKTKREREKDEKRM